MVKIEELALILSDRYGLDREACLSFVTAMFDVVVAELAANPDATVKIKGLGTFKVMSAGARDARLAFTPEVMLRDRVNRPFLQFETVVLNDGADFSTIDSDDSLPSAVAGDEEFDESEPMDDNESESMDDNDAEPVDGNESEAASNYDAESVEDNAADGECNEGVDAATVANVPDANDDGVPMVDGNDVKGDNVTSSDDSQRVIARQLMSAGGRADAPVCRQKNPRLMYWLSAASFVLLLLIGIGMYFLYDSVERKNAAIEKIEHKIAPRRPAVESVSIAAVRSLDVDADTSKAVFSSAPQNVARPHAPSPSVTDYNHDPRVRTGAYVIVGIDSVVKVRRGQTLESISRARLGAGMECYVEAVNGGIKDVKEGDALRIPKLKLKPRCR